MRSLVLLAALAAGFLPATPISAQAVTQAADPAEMKALDWLVGRWTGAGSVSRGPGGRMDALVRESATRHAGGHVLVLEGLGTSGTDTVHNAFAVIWYDTTAATHRMRAFRSNGHIVDSDLAVTERGIVWGFQEPSGMIRFTVTRTDEGKWHEVGEFSRDGSTWHRFMEMTLTRDSGS